MPAAIARWRWQSRRLCARFSPRSIRQGRGRSSRLASPQLIAQLGRAQVGRVDGRSRLVLAPALGEGARVDSLEADLVDQPGHDSFGLLVVSRDRDADSLRIAGGPAQIAQSPPVDGIEGLDDACALHVRLKQLARGSPVGVELLEVPVAIWVVVVRIDHDLA